MVSIMERTPQPDFDVVGCWVCGDATKGCWHCVPAEDGKSWDEWWAARFSELAT